MKILNCTQSAFQPLFLVAISFFFSQKTTAQCTAPSFGSDCASACFWPGSAFSGFTLSNYGLPQSTVLPPAFCGSIEHAQWFQIAPSAATTTFTVTPNNCLDGNGLQIALYQDCSAPSFLGCNVGCSGCWVDPQSITVDSLVPNAPYYLMVDGWAGDQCEIQFTADPPLSDSIASQFFHYISGKVKLDLNHDCLPDAANPPAIGWPVQLLSNPVKTTYTQADGSFKFWVPDTAQYTVKLISPNFTTSVYAICQNLITTSANTPINFLATEFATNCSFVSGNIAHSAMRPCVPTSINVHFENVGTVVANNVVAKVLIDKNWIPTSYSQNPYSKVGDTLFFNLGNLAIQQKGDIKMYGHVKCDASLAGQAICTKLWLPGKICDTIGIGLDQPVLTPKITCVNGDIAHFDILNSGTEPTQIPRKYIIIEDEVVIKTGELVANFQPGQHMNFDLPAKGLIVRLEVEQENFLPYFSDHASSYLVDCGGITTPFVANQWPLGSNLPWEDEDCRQITNSYDPNHKSAQPIGFSGSHFIRHETDIEYLVEFQNLGTDTAFLVQILDKLDPNLDPTSIRILGSSHPMRFEFSGIDQMRFVFEKIHLPSAAQSPLNSQGFVKFVVSQKSHLPDFTQIKNVAEIIFDHNPSILTNQVAHSVCDECLWATVDVHEIAADAPRITIMPNPFFEKTTVTINGGQPGEKIFRLFDIAGQLLKMEKFVGDRFDISGENLPSGTFIFSIEMGGLKIAAGRLVKN